MGVQLSNYFTTYTIYNVTRTSFMYFSPAPPPPSYQFCFYPKLMSMYCQPPEWIVAIDERLLSMRNWCLSQLILSRTVYVG